MVEAKKRLSDAADRETDANRRLRDAQWALNEAYYQQAHSTAAAAGGVDKYAEAMSKLSPNARQFVTDIKSLSGAFGELRNNVQDKLFDGLGQKIVDLSNNYLPTLNKGLGDIASGFNSGLSKIIDQMSRPENISAWSNIFSNTAASVDKFLGGLGYLGSALTTIASVGSDFLPGIGQSFQDTMQKFDEWIKGLDSNGKLKEFIQGAIDKFHELWDIGSKIVELVKNIFSGGKDTGDDMLKSISTTLDKWNQFLGSPEGQQKLKDFFEDVKQSAKDIASTISAAADIVHLVSGMGPRDDGKKKPTNIDESKSTGAGANSARLKDKDGNTVDSEGNPAWNPGESGLAATIPVIPKNGIIGKAGRGVAGLFGYSSRDGDDGAGSWDGGAWKQTGERWANVGKSVKDSYDKNIGPTITSFVQGMQNIGSTALDKLQNVGSSAWGSISNAASTAGSTISTAAQGVGQWFADLGTKAGSAKDAVVQKMDDMLNWLGGLGSSIAQKTSGMWNGISEAFKESLNWIIDRWNAFTIKVGGWEIMGKKLPSLTVSMPQIPRLYAGGAVRDENGRLSGPGTGTSDSIVGVNADGIPIVRVADKETVVTADASNHPGNQKILTAMNQGEKFNLPGLATGGAVEDPNAKSNSTFVPGSEQGKPSGPTSPTGKPSDLAGMMSFLSSMASTALYAMGGFSRTDIDCSGLVSAGINALFGEDPFVGRMNTTVEGPWLSARGFTLGKGGNDSITIGFYDQGGGAFGHTAGTLPGGTPFEAHGPDGTPIEYGSGQGADQSIFTDFWHLAIAPQDLLNANVNVSGGNLPNPTYPGTGTTPNSTNTTASTDPSATTDSDKPTTISGWAGKFAQDAATYYAQDTLGVFGIPDELPGAVNAAFVVGNAVGTQGNDSLSGLAGLAGKAQTNSRGAYTAPKTVTVPDQNNPNTPTNTPGQTTSGPTTSGQTTPGQAKLEGPASDQPASPSMPTDVPEGGIAAGTPGAKEAVYSEWLKYGWTEAAQWLDTLRLINGESSWDVGAANPSSTAQGLFQFLDTTRAQFPYGATAAEQAVGGGQYIKSRYHTPSDAWQFWSSQSPHWYDAGGRIPVGDTWVRNQTGKPEAVLTDEQWSDVSGILGALSGPVLDNLNRTIADTSATAMTSAANTVPGVGPAVQAGIGAMRTFNSAVESGLGVAQTFKNSAAQTLTTHEETATKNVNSHNRTTNYHISGTDAQTAMRLARLREQKEAMAYAGGRS